MSLLAKAVVKNKCWIVEDHGEKVATILSGPAGYTLVRNHRRERFTTFKLLSDKYNIVFDKSKTTKSSTTGTHDVYGYSTDHKPHNILWDVHHKLPVYTKDNKSKSYYCAGWYLVKFGQYWEEAYCPKLISLNRYPYQGPYKTRQEVMDNLVALYGDSNGTTN